MRELNKSRWNWLAFAIVVFMLTASLGGVTTAAETEGGVVRSDYSISGNGMVWLEGTDGGLKKLMYRNTATGQQLQITDGATAVDAPHLNGNWIVWAGKGDEPLPSLNWYIFGYDLLNRSTVQLSRSAGEYTNPSADDSGAVWYERSQYGSMIYRDLVTGSQFSLGEGRFPVLADGVVVYKNARDGGLSMLELSSGVRKRLVSLGGTSYVDWFVFNGAQVLVREHYSDGRSQYGVLAVGASIAPDVHPIASTSDRNQLFELMELSDGHGVILTKENGTATITSINLETRKVVSMPAPASMSQVIGVRNGKLVYAVSGGAVQEMTLEPNTPGTVPGDGDSGGGDTGGTDGGNTSGPGSGEHTGGPGGPGNSAHAGGDDGGAAADIVLSYFDAEGGVLVSDDGSAKIAFAQGAFASRTGTALLPDSDSGRFYDESGKKLQPAGKAWRLTSQNALQKPALLSLRHFADNAGKSETEKLGIYRLVRKSGEADDFWSYIGGASRIQEGFIQAAVTEPGVYAVMLRQATFGDIKGHWAQREIEVLASRGVVNGKAQELYAPGQTLTRAEFAKLLAGAMGIKPSAGGASSFSDVGYDQWYFGWIEAASKAGYVQGNGGQFRPNDPVTREQMVTMLLRAIKSWENWKEEADSDVDTEPGSAAASEPGGSHGSNAERLLSSYSDSDSISGWAKESVAAAVEYGLIQGVKDKLSPQDKTTRAQAAAVIYRLLDVLNKL
jgi:hypothetical protein